MPWGIVAGAVISGVMSDRASSKAAKAQKDAASAADRYTREAADTARQDVANRYNDALLSQAIGLQGANDMFNRGSYEQFNTFQQGNLGAQQALLSTLPQMNNALLGMPIDYGAMQTQQIQHNPLSMQYRLPDHFNPESLPTISLGNIGAQNGGVNNALTQEGLNAFLTDRFNINPTDGTYWTPKGRKQIDNYLGVELPNQSGEKAPPPDINRPRNPKGRYLV